MTIQEAIDLLQEMLKCKNGDCDPRLCGECDLCQKRRDEIDEVWEMALRSLEAWETITKQIKEFGKSQSFVMNGYTNGVRDGCKKSVDFIESYIGEIEKGGSE